MRDDSHFRPHAVALLLLTWLCFPLVVRAQSWSSNEESLKIDVDAEWAFENAPGYLPVRFDITNSGDNRVIEIVGEGQRYGVPENPGD